MAHSNRVICLYRAGDHQALVPYVERLLAENPLHPFRGLMLYYKAQSLYYHFKRYGDAFEAYRNAMEHLAHDDPRYETSFFLSGNALMKQSEAVRAIDPVDAERLAGEGSRILMEYLAIPGGNIHRRLWALYRTEQYAAAESEALAYLAGAGKIAPYRFGQIMLVVGSSRAYKKPPDLAGSREAFEAVLAADIDDNRNPDVHLKTRACDWLVNVCFQQGDPKSAQRYFEMIRDSMPDGPARDAALQRHRAYFR
jgi:tetratricopeptide (TPR) repeat protein